MSSAQPWRRIQWWAVPALLAISAALAVSSLVHDSITFDETDHLAAGLSYLRTGDLRISPENPPLARMWAALPALFMDYRWPDPQECGWREGLAWAWGKCLLFLDNDGQPLIVAARCQMVVLLLLTELTVYFCAKALAGNAAGLLALAISAFCPTLLAYGRLVTTDLPVALLILLTVLAYSRVGQRLEAKRLLAALLSIAALSVTKFSWVIVIPALLVMGIYILLADKPWTVQWASRSSTLCSRPRKFLALLIVGAATALAIYVGIWLCYGVRYSMFRGADAAYAETPAAPNRAFPKPAGMEEVWECTLSDNDGLPLTGLSARCIRWARRHHFLPEAYLYGLAFVARSTEARPTYLMGEFSATGWWSYFPIAFAIKTPIGTMLLMAGGFVALLRRVRPRSQEPILLVGLLGFLAVSAIVLISSSLNIGHRHLLPLYLPLIIVAGFAATWPPSRLGRTFIAGGAAMAAYAGLSIWPNYLSYFNELVGGPKNGHLYLLDSNIDWGQDLKRLAEYARRHPTEKIKLAYFGSAEPALYGVNCEMLPSFLGFHAPLAGLNAGTYVVSVTQLYGVYDPMAQRSFWESGNGPEQYRRLARELSQPVPGPESEADLRQRAGRRLEYRRLRYCRLLYELSRRAPDERIGWSMFVYRLTQNDVDAMLAM